MGIAKVALKGVAGKKVKLTVKNVPDDMTNEQLAQLLKSQHLKTIEDKSGIVLLEDIPEFGGPSLPGAPNYPNIPGRGVVRIGRNEKAIKAAEDYSQRTGIPLEQVYEYVGVDPDRAKRIAREYDLMKHAPKDPEVKKAYKQLAKETLDQYDNALVAGAKPYFITGKDPYANSPYEALIDLETNDRLGVFPTSSGFGTDTNFDPKGNPLLADSGYKIDGQPALVNDLFRFIHDYYGHAKQGAGFRAMGEENAFQSHAGMFSPLARRAMTTETRGQNSWLNYGPYGEANRSATIDDTVFADQKTGLMPIWTTEEGRLSAANRRQRFQEALRERRTGLEGAVDESGRVSLDHYARQPLDRIDPARQLTGLVKPGTAEYNRLAGKTEAPQRSYYGIPAKQHGYKPEPGLGAHKHRAFLDGELLYDAKADPDKLWKKGDQNKSEASIKGANYSGYYFDHPQLGKVAVVFDPLDAVKIKQKGFANPVLLAGTAAFTAAMATLYSKSAEAGKFTKGANVGDFIKATEQQHMTSGPQGSPGQPVDYAGNKLTVDIPPESLDTPEGIAAFEQKYGRKPVHTMTADERKATFAQRPEHERLLDEISPLVDVGGVSVPGGLDGKFSLSDMFYLKNSGINPRELPDDVHTAIFKKMLRSVEKENPKAPLEHFDRLAFGITSGNAPLTKNEFEWAQLRPRSDDEMKQLAASYPGTSAERLPDANAYNRSLAESVGAQSAPAGGTGVRNTADYSNVATLAQDMGVNPDFFLRQPDEDWAHYVERINNQARGLGAKTGSLGIAFTDPVNSPVSAIDRHIADLMLPELKSDPDGLAKLQQTMVTLYNGTVPKSKQVKTHKGVVARLDAKKLAALESDAIRSFVSTPALVKYRDTKGNIREEVPENLRDPSNYPFYEPTQVQAMPSSYKIGLQKMTDEGAPRGLEGFGNQWLAWDKQRQRLEPHEIFATGAVDLPRLTPEEYSFARKQHSDAGFFRTAKDAGGRLSPTKPRDDYRKLMYWSAGAGVTAPLLTGIMAGTSQPVRADEQGQPEYETRLQQVPYPQINNPDGSFSTHEMAAEVDDAGNWIAFPTIQPGANGQLERLPVPEAQARAVAEGNFKPFGEDQQGALDYAEGGYKADTVLPMRDPVGDQMPDNWALQPQEPIRIGPPPVEEMSMDALRRQPSIQPQPEAAYPMTMNDLRRPEPAPAGGGFSDVHNATEFVGRAMGGMALGGLQALGTLTSNLWNNQSFDTSLARAVSDIDRITQWATSGGSILNGGEDYQAGAMRSFDKLGTAARGTFGDDLVDMYMQGLTPLADRNEQALRRLGYPRAGAAWGSAIQAGEMFMPMP